MCQGERVHVEIANRSGERDGRGSNRYRYQRKQKGGSDASQTEHWRTSMFMNFGGKSEPKNDRADSKVRCYWLRRDHVNYFSQIPQISDWPYSSHTIHTGPPPVHVVLF